MRLSVLRKYSGTNGHMSDYRTESSEPKNALNTISIEYKSYAYIFIVGTEAFLWCGTNLSDIFTVNLLESINNYINKNKLAS